MRRRANRSAPPPHQNWVSAVAYSPDGKTVLSGSADKTARLWDVATGKPIDAPLQHQGEVYAVAYSPDGKAVLTGSAGKTARLWSLPEPVEGEPKRITCWVQVLTNMEFDEGGAAHALSGQEWLDRRRQLEALDGPPITPTTPVGGHR
jgi:WD40 repeat protein